MNIRDFFKGKEKPEAKTQSVKNVFFGLQVFFVHDWPIQLYYASRLKPNRIRTWITEKNYDPKQFAGFLNRANQGNMAVLCTICNESNRDKTDELAYTIAVNHAKSHNLYLYEILNEPNGEICPNNLVHPDRYMDIYKRCFSKIRSVRNDTHIYPAGLIGSSKADIPCIKYIKELIRLGIKDYIEDKVRISAWNLHFYKEHWNESGSIVRYIRQISSAPIWVTETGVAGHNLQEQQKWYRVANELCGKHGIEQLMWYGLKWAGNPMNPNEDYSLLDQYFKESDMFKFLEQEAHK